MAIMTMARRQVGVVLVRGFLFMFALFVGVSLGWYELSHCKIRFDRSVAEVRAL
jgi:hypothetical protein